MTLLHIITRLSLGGSARNTIDSAWAASRAGYRTLLVTGPSENEVDVTSAAKQIGCEVILFPSLRREISPARDLKALFQTIRLIHEERIQIIHTHTSKAGFIGRLAAILTRVPVIVHTPHGHIFYSYYGPLLTRFFIELERLAARWCDRIVVLTERGAEEHLAQRIGRPHQYVAIPSGVDIEALRSRLPSRQQARSQLGWDDGDLFILGVGRLVSVKGFDVAVDAMAQVIKMVPNAHLILFGDGPERSKLVSLAREKGIGDRLTITGVSEDVSAYLAAADLFVAPSRNEGMGRSIVEAMSAGLPVVASQVGGIPSVITDGECGRLVPSENPDALAGALTELLKDSSLRTAQGELGKKRAELFSLQRMETLLLKMYEDVATQKGLAVTEASRGGAAS